MIKEQQRDWYDYQEKIHLAVDCIVFGFDQGRLKLLVFKRLVEPLRGQWSLIGSFVKNDENVGRAAERVLRELTGLGDIYLKELKCYSAIDRDPGDRCVSIAHYALIAIEGREVQAMNESEACWFDVAALPELLLDHNRMVEDALQVLKIEARRQPIGFELLPDRFTMPQLQSLYEAIYGKELDSRNFRKKVTSLNVLIKTDKKDFSTSRKGAYLYRFDLRKYNKLLRAGYDFVI